MDHPVTFFMSHQNNNQRPKKIFMKISSNNIQNYQNYDLINKVLIFFQLRTWGRRRLTSFGFLLIRLQASLLASTFGNHHHHSQSHHHHHHHSQSHHHHYHHHHHHHVIIVMIVMIILLGIRCLQM